jgi:anti-sigma B factor antagonist
MTYTTSHNGAHLLLHLKGNLTSNLLAAEWMAEAENHLNNGGENLIVELSELDNMNSTGINCFLNLLNLYKKQGKQLFIAGANERITGILAITKLNTVFVMTDNVTQALNYKLPETKA